MFIRNLKAITAVLMLCLSLAQTSNAAQTGNAAEYTFTPSTGTYTSLTAPPATSGTGTLLERVQAGEVISTHVNQSDGGHLYKDQEIGFDFEYCGQIFKKFIVTDYGYIVLGDGAPGVTRSMENNAVGYFEDRFKINALAVFHDQIKSSGKYQLTGTAGSRVLTIEYYNIHWMLGKPTDPATTNRKCQIKLYEGSNKIEYIYSIGSTVDVSPLYTNNKVGASIKIFGPDKKYISVTPAATATKDSTTPNNDIASNDFLKNGVTYKFEPIQITAAPGQAMLADATEINVNSFRANWAPTSGADKYELTVATDNGFTSLVASSPIDAKNTQSFKVEGLLENTTYFYKVKPYNGSLAGVESSVKSVKTLGSGTIGTAESFGSGLPSSWSIDNRKVGGGTGAWVAETNNGVGNDTYPNKNDGHYMSVPGEANTYANNWLISPVYQIDSTSGAKLTYKVCGGNAANTSNANNYKIYITEAGSINWEQAFEQRPSHVDTEFREVTLEIPSKYNGKAIQIAIAYTGFDGSIFSIDDFIVKTSKLIEIPKSEFEPQEDVAIAFKNSTATTTDWIAIYKDGTVPASGNSEAWNYLNDSQTAPAAPVTSGTVTLKAPSAEGTYIVVYHPNGGYTYDSTKAIQITVKAKAPDKVVVKASTVPTNDTFTANWEATTAPTYAPVTGYKLYVSTASTCDKDFVSGYDPKPLGATITSEVVTGLSIATNYYYKVVATSTAGDSVDSGIIKANTLSGKLIETAKALYEPSEKITVTFGNVNSQVKDWIGIYEKDKALTSPAIGSSFENQWNYLNNTKTAPTTAVTSGTVELNAPMKVGDYRIVYFLNDGHDFDVAKVIDITVEIKKPVAVKATASTPPAKVSFTANWEAAVAANSPVTGYKLYVSTDAACAGNFVAGYGPKDIAGKDVISAVISGLTENTSYYYKVVVVNAGGDSPGSNIITARTVGTGVLGVVETFTAGIPNTWAVLDKDKDGKTWIAQTNDGTDTKFPTGNDGHYVSCLSATGMQGDNRLISPAFTIDAAGATLSYKVTNGYEGTQADDLKKHHQVMVSIVGSGVWKELLTDSLTNPTTGFRAVTAYIDQAEYLGKDIQIAFVYDSQDGLALSIDDVLVDKTKLITTGSQVEYEAGKAISVTFKNNGSAVGDRIAVYKRSNALTSPIQGGYIDLKYLNDSATPPVAIAPATVPVGVKSGKVTLTAPNYPGEYRLVYLPDGGYDFDPATAVDITVNPGAAVTINAGITLGHTSFRAQWQPTNGATGYKLYVSTDPACKNNFIPGYGPLEVGPINAQKVVNVVDSETYYYKVVALSGTLEAPESNITKVEPLLITPAYGVSTKLEGQTLSWTVDFEDTVTSYRVEQEVNGKWIAVTTVAATGEADAKYQVAVADDHANYRVVSVDGNGFTQAFGVNDGSLFVSLNEGWNLLSVPVNNADLSGINGTVWAWNGEKYVAVETAQAMQGLWVYAETAKDLTITGTPAKETTLSLVKGWNLAGPINNCKAPTGFNIYTWNETYSKILANGGLIRGTGYWFFSDSAQKLQLK